MPEPHSHSMLYPWDRADPSRLEVEKAIPSKRTLVVCLDGTGDQFDDDNSNVVNFFSLLAKGKSSQLVYYQAGIGTYTVPHVATPLRSKITKGLDMMLGFSLRHHVTDAYKFLMENFKFGDHICIFGFSRGAYTARTLAGMIEKVGLLPSGNDQQVPFAYKMYMKNDELGWKQSFLFKRTFSIDVRVEFVGVWDTVDSIGLIPHHVPFVKKNTCVKTFRHALALDERRGKFKPNRYDIMGLPEENSFRENARCENRLGQRVSDHPLELTDVLEVWFAGCHSDVGGGSVDNGTRYSLSRIPLRWMISQCYLTRTGIRFYTERLHMVGFDHRRITTVIDGDSGSYWRNLDPPPSPPFNAYDVRATLEDEGPNKRRFLEEKDLQQWILRLSEDDAKIKCKNCVGIDDELEAHIVAHLQGSLCGEEKAKAIVVDENHEELHDALSPMYDQLSLQWKYRFLEWIPFFDHQVSKEGKVSRRLAINRGRPRTLSEEDKNKIKVHRSVKTRMEVDASLLGGRKYTPRLQLGDRLKADVHFVD